LFAAVFIVHFLQFFDGQKNLPHLVRLRTAFVVLNIDAGISDPWRLENRVTGSALARLSEEVHADFEEISEANIARLPPHGFEDLLHCRHCLWYHYWNHSLKVKLGGILFLTAMATSKPKTFKAVLESTGDRLRWVIARVPFDIAQAWPERNGRRVRGTVNGFAFRTSLFPEKGGERYVLLVNRKMQAGAKAGAGESVRITLEPDLEERPCEMPVEFDRALKGAKRLRKFFESISPSMQKGFTNYVAEPKSAEIRRKRADQMAEALLLAMEGEQEPPPILRAAFQRQPLAEAGWHAMTPLKRRYHLLAIFYRQTAQAREQRTRGAIEDALCVAKRRLERSPGTT
jgi:uncharacterized protein YdeI (YjbR/CyaY-like superfamily)